MKCEMLPTGACAVVFVFVKREREREGQSGHRNEMRPAR